MKSNNKKINKNENSTNLELGLKFPLDPSVCLVRKGQLQKCRCNGCHHRQQCLWIVAVYCSDIAGVQLSGLPGL